MLWPPEMAEAVSELTVFVAVTSLWPSYVTYVYCEPVNSDSGTVDPMMENEFVKEKDEASELDCVLEPELEETFDPVLEEDSVLCCAPTLNATKQWSHIFGCRIAA
jgi:hypothetical protein